MRWTMIRSEWCKCLFSLMQNSNHPWVIQSWEKTIAGDCMISGSWFVAPCVREAHHVRMWKEKWHVCISIIHCVTLFSVQKLFQVMFHNWCLTHSCRLCSCSISLNAISKCKDIFKSLMLESIGVDVNQTWMVSNTWIKKLLMWYTLWINISHSKCFIYHFSCVKILESSNLLSNFISWKFNHFPTQHHIYSSLMAFIKCNFICIRKLIYWFIWWPILDSSSCGTDSMKLILSQEWFIIRSIKIAAFSFVWELGRVTNHISTSMTPPIENISSFIFSRSLFFIKTMSKHFLLGM